MKNNKVNIDVDNASPKLKRELGFISATAIVVGNMIGSGIFMTPTNLAAVSTPIASIIAWIITSVGSILIAMSFAKLACSYPKTGGPIVYAKEAFGEFVGFLVAWMYWIGSWVGNAAIITAFMSYLTYFIPQLSSNGLAAFLVSSAMLWTFTIVNIRGVKGVGIISIVTTGLKLLILLVFTILAATSFDPQNFLVPSSESLSGVSGISSAAAVTLWCFIGLESATIPAGEIKNPEKNIRKSTIWGTIISAIIYITISIFAIGAMPQSHIAASNAPLADIINHATGLQIGGSFIALGAVISTFGAISGWILSAGTSAFAAAEEGIFPKAFAGVSKKYNTPYKSLIITGVATNILLIMNYTGGLSTAFEFMIMLATLSYLPIYVICTAAEMKLLVKGGHELTVWRFIKRSLPAILAFAYCIYAIYGTGADVVMYGFILMLLGIPFYIYIKLKSAK